MSLYNENRRYNGPFTYNGESFVTANGSPWVGLVLFDIAHEPSTEREYTVFDPTALGAHLEIEQSGLVLTHNAPGDSISRMCLAGDGKTSGVWSFLCMAWGSAELADSHALPDYVSVGVASSAEALSNYVGETSESVGWRLGGGTIKTNAANSFSGLEVVVGSQLVLVVADLDASPQKVKFYAGNELQGSVDLPSGKTWHFAASLGGVDAYDLRLYANSGVRQFEAAPPAGIPTGWYSETAAPTTTRVATEAYQSQHWDVPAVTNWWPHVGNEEAWFERAINFYMWAPDPLARIGLGEITITNDGRYDSFSLVDLRGQRVLIRTIANGYALEFSRTIGYAIVERNAPTSEKSIRVALRDRFTKLRRALQRKFFLPSAIDAVANLPEPISLGAVRNVRGIEFDTVNRRFKFGDAGLTNIAVVRDKGDPLDPSAGDYAPLGDLTGVQLDAEPIGLVTADISSSGTVAITPGADDVLDGIGEFTTWTPGSPSDTPDGWDVYGDPLTSSPDAGGQIDEFSGAAVFRSRSKGGGWWIRTSSDVLVAGRTYRWTWTVNAIIRPVNPSSGPQGFASLAVIEATDSQVQNNHPKVLSCVTAPGTYTGLYTVPDSDTDLKVFVGLWADVLSGSWGGVASANIDNIRFEELADFVAAPLEGISLEQYMQEILVTRGEEDPESYSVEDLQAIDAATGYPFGYHSPDPPNIVDAMVAPFASFGMGAYLDENDVIRFARLRDPETASDDEIVLDITESMCIEVPVPYLDEAPGLTTTIGVRKNWHRYTQADFVEDDSIDGVTAAQRKAFMAEAQIYRSSSVQLAPRYRFARKAPPLISLLDSARVGQARIDEDCGFYKDNRYFIPLLVKRSAGVVNPSNIIRLTHSRWGFAAGRKLYVARVRISTTRDRQIITGWFRHAL